MKRVSSATETRSNPLICPSKGPMKNEVPFGAYLIAKNLISPGELEAALVIQTDRNPKLGSLAARRAMLNFEKVRSVYEYQINHNAKFGQAAVALGLLTREEVETLLAEQSIHHTYLGEILVDLKILTPQRLDEMLDSYCRETGAVIPDAERHRHPHGPAR